MQIVLSGALPEPHQARELINHIEQKAPTLVRWLQQSHCQSHRTSPSETRCTAVEVWQLEQAGFVTQPAQHLSAGLGPLFEKTQNSMSTNRDSPVWLAELVHIAPSRDGAALITGEALDISEAESTELLLSTKKWFSDTDFDAEYNSPTRWKLQTASDFNPHTTSSKLVSQSMVNDWWEQDLHSRPWRRLVNEFQMLWFDHPINNLRTQAGKLPINSLWLLGGASPAQFSNLAHQPTYQLYNDLEESAARQDWGTWLEQLENLERNVFAPLSQTPTPELILCGVDRYLHSKASQPSLLKRLFSTTKSNWRDVCLTP